MFNDSIWLICIGLEALLLVCGARAGLWRKLPLFYTYIACVLAKDLLSIPIYDRAPSLYGSFYWGMALLLAAVSYGVLMEVYNQLLKGYPGVANFLRVLLGIVFFVIIAKVGVDAFGGAAVPFGHTVATLERDLRQLQAVLVTLLIALLLYYNVRIGKGLRGLLVGYSLLISVEVIAQAFEFHPASGFAPLMRRAEPLLYAITLVIWLRALWTYAPEVAPEVPCGIEHDYRRLATATKMMLDHAVTHIIRSGRT